jgi:hypothetical protein
MLRPMRFEGFTHNRAVMRFSDFANLLDSQDAPSNRLLSGGSEICPPLTSSQDRQQTAVRRPDDD